MYTCYSRSHRVLLDNFFIPSIPEDVEINIEEQSQLCDTGKFRSDKWENAVSGKINYFINAIKKNIGEILIFSDCDVQFFGKIEEDILKEIEDYDFAFQDERGTYCTGFFACKASENAVMFLEEVYDKIQKYGGDQEAVYYIINEHKYIKAKKLSKKFWTHAGHNIGPPDNILVHHANCMEGIENKINLLDTVRKIVKEKSNRIISQSPIACCSSKTEKTGSVKNIFGVEYIFNKLDIDSDFAIDIESRSKLSEEFDANQRIWVHVEPEPYTKYFDGFEEYYKGGIFSWHPKVCKLPQFSKITTGIRGVSPNFSINKKFGVSGLVSSKCFDWYKKLEENGRVMEGYRLRRSIICNQDSITIPSMVWNSQKNWKGIEHDYPIETKDIAMNYMFHFAIENCFENNYFTEKITDCFMTCCIPIYFGDHVAVSNHFNMDGVIVVNEDNWIDKINSLTEEDYYDRISAIEDNSNRVLMFLHNTKDIYKNISEIILSKTKKSFFNQV